MRLKFIAAATATLLLISPSAHPVGVLKMEQIPDVFRELTKDKSLANPAMVLIDVKSGKVIFSRDGNGPRKPASTLKVISAMSILEFMPADSVFTTSIYKTDLKNTFQLVGDFDPSLTPSYSSARRDKFIWSNYLVNKIRANAKSRSITIRYYGITSRTRINMANYFRKVGYRVAWKPISASATSAHITDLISTSTSPNLSAILRHTLLWSDNNVADYLARLAAMKAGYTYSEDGITPVFNYVLGKYNIENPVITAKDGSGLSSANRISALTLARALAKIYQDPKFASILSGLPVGGVSGTMQNRFLKTAPQGVGLVRAKTGSLRGVASLAGYIDSGDHEYAFVIIADRVGKYRAAESAARATMDRILGKITAPLILVPSDATSISSSEGNSDSPLSDNAATNSASNSETVINQT